MDRRSFLRAASGLFVAAAAAPIVEPVERVRRWWQVGRNAPVSERGLVMAFEPMSREQIAAMYVSHEQRTNDTPAGSAALRMTVMYFEHEQRMRAIDEHVRRGEMFGVDTDYQQWKAAQRQTNALAGAVRVKHAGLEMKKRYAPEIKPFVAMHDITFDPATRDRTVYDVFALQGRQLQRIATGAFGVDGEFSTFAEHRLTITGIEDLGERRNG